MSMDPDYMSGSSLVFQGEENFYFFRFLGHYHS